MHLNLSGCILSSLCFIQHLPKLEIKNLSHCENLQDCDFTVISNCSSLECLYLSFNKVKATTLNYIVLNTPALQTLDICGIYLTTAEISNILDKCYHSLLLLHMSLHEAEDEELFDRFIHLNYIDLTCYMHNFKRRQ